MDFVMILMIAGQRSTSKTCADLKATLYFDKVQFAESNIPFSFSDIVIVIVTEFPQIWMGLRDRFCLNFITKQQSTSKTCSYSKASGQHCTSTMCKVNMTCRYNESRHSKCDHTPVKRRRTSTARAVLVAPSNVVLRQRAFTKSLSNAVLRRRARF